MTEQAKSVIESDTHITFELAKELIQRQFPELRVITMHPLSCYHIF